MAGTFHQKRVLTIQDVSCLGRCSLTVALPIISAGGIEAAILPTAILSTHTGGFTGFTFRDLTDDIEGIIAHWDSLGLDFDAVYTGYLGSARQLSIAKKIFDQYRATGALILVDPVMADNGKLYPGFPEDFPKGMAGLCAGADIVVPNLTEAAFMLDAEYIESGYDRAYIEGILRRLHGLGAKKAVLTGVSFEEDKIGAACFDGETVSYYFTKRYPGAYHGTGDVFSSLLLASFVRTGDLSFSVQTAVDITADTIRHTIEDGVPEDSRHYGPHFEKSLPAFAERLNGR